MAKALINPLDNLIRVQDNIQEIFNGIVEKENPIMAIDLLRFSQRVGLIKSIESMVSVVMDEIAIDRINKVYAFIKISILSNLNELKNNGGVPNELNQVLSIDDFLELSTYNLKERMDMSQLNASNPKVFTHFVTSMRKMEKNQIEGVDGPFSVLNKSLQKAHSSAQKITIVGSALPGMIETSGVLDIIYNYLEGFGKNDAKNAISKIIFYLNDQAPHGLLGCVGGYLEQDEQSPLYVQPGEGKVFGILDQQFGDDGIAMFATLPFSARSIILDYTGIEEYYICDTPAVLGEVAPDA